MKKHVLIAALVVLSVASFMIAPISCSPAGQRESITVAWAPFESTGLLWIAEEQDFFSRNGLNVALRRYDTGAGALDGALKGEADIAVGPSEFPVVGRAFGQGNVRIIGTVDKADFIYLISRKDLGIENISDLKGKKVGTTLGTVAHFFLGRFLELHGIDIQDVTLVDLKTPDEWVNAVANGEIDAVATAQPYAFSARERLGSNAVVFPAQSGQLLYGLIVCSEEWISEHPEAARRFLKALAQADDYQVRNPAGAKAIVQRRLELKAEYVEAFWSQNHFALSLEDSLITAMEDEARWMIKHNLTTQEHVPDFLDYIYEDALKAVKPEAVEIVR